MNDHGLQGKIDQHFANRNRKEISSEEYELAVSNLCKQNNITDPGVMAKAKANYAEFINSPGSLENQGSGTGGGSSGETDPIVVGNS